MDDRTREREFINSLEVYQSLLEAMNEAGGTVFTIDGLQEMTVSRFLSVLAPNSIRFVYAPPKKKAETTKRKETANGIFLSDGELKALEEFLENYTDEMKDEEGEDTYIAALYDEICDFLQRKGK